MFKVCRTLFVSGCLILQVVASLPQRTKRFSPTIEDSKEKFDADMADAFKKWGLDFFYDSISFLGYLLKHMKDLPTKSEGIQANITRLSDALKEVGSVEPDKLSEEELYNTIDLLDDIFDDFLNMPNDDNPKSDAGLVMNLFEKAYNDQEKENSAKVSDDNIHEIAAFFETYENLMDEEERHAAASLLEWYEDNKNFGDKPINADLLARLKA